jgi:hypothetical protein
MFLIFLSQNSTFSTSNLSMSAGETNQPDIGDATDQNINMPMFEPITLEMDIGACCVHGSARTSFTYQDIVRERDRRKGNTSPTSTDPISSSTGMRVPSDVVLGTGLLGSSQDIAHSLLLQVTPLDSVEISYLYHYFDRLCGLVVRVSGHRSRGPGFDS